jgi:hypothetical protein
MNKTFLLLGLAMLLGCSAKTTSSTKIAEGTGDTRTREVQLLDETAYLITETTDDKTYGYDKSNPVKVGGSSDQSGPMNERRFLNGLLGPNGEQLRYFRAGSCCAFKTPNGLMNNTGLLDSYRVYWDGGKDTLNIYINMYDKGDLKIPVGLTARKK